MEINKAVESEKIKRQLKRFLVAGFSAVGTDMVVYLLLISRLEYSYAKGVSFLSGTIVSYIINKFWTFEEKSKSLGEFAKFMTLYLITLTINIYVNKTVLAMSNLVILGFLTATGVSMVLNFIGQKWWVFKK